MLCDVVVGAVSSQIFESFAILGGVLDAGGSELPRTTLIGYNSDTLSVT